MRPNIVAAYLAGRPVTPRKDQLLASTGQAQWTPCRPRVPGPHPRAVSLARVAALDLLPRRRYG